MMLRTTKILKGKDDKELRRIYRKLDRSYSKVTRTRWKLEERICDCESSERKCQKLLENISYTVGRRKGDKCPALKTTIEKAWSRKVGGNINITYFGCGCEGRAYYLTPYKFFQQCYKCKLSRKRAFQQMVYNGVFVKQKSR